MDGNGAIVFFGSLCRFVFQHLLLGLSITGGIMYIFVTPGVQQL